MGVDSWLLRLDLLFFLRLSHCCRAISSINEPGLGRGDAALRKIPGDGADGLMGAIVLMMDPFSSSFTADE